MVEDEPRRGYGNICAGHRRRRRRPRRKARRRSRGIVRKSQQRAAAGRVVTLDAMGFDKLAHAIVETIVGIEVLGREIIETDERVTRNAPAALDALQQAGCLRHGERAVSSDGRQNVGGNNPLGRVFHALMLRPGSRRNRPFRKGARADPLRRERECRAAPPSSACFRVRRPPRRSRSSY